MVVLEYVVGGVEGLESEWVEGHHWGYRRQAEARIVAEVGIDNHQEEGSSSD